MKLNVQDWKEFNVTRLFDICAGNYYSSDDYEYGTTPYVSASATNNGVGQMIDLPPDFSENKIVTGKVECKAFYQGKPFSATSDANIFAPKFEMSQNVGLFLTSIITFNENGKWSYGRQCRVGDSKEIVVKLPIQHNEDNTPVILNLENYRYSYGRKFNQDNIRNTVMKLPAKQTSNGSYIPDWQFMEDYIKSLHHKPITTKVKSGLVKELDVDNWEEFKISGLFTLLNGKGITKEEIEENSGTFVAVQSGEENNGVLGKIDKQYCIKMGYTLTDKMCLTVARTGSAGFVSFQSAGCVVGDSAKILLLDDNIATTNVYLFLQTVLTANRFKYDYGRKVTEDKYLSDIIKLPIKRDSDGKPVIDDNRTYSDSGYIPDWQYMEDYINSLPYSDRI